MLASNVKLLLVDDCHEFSQMLRDYLTIKGGFDVVVSDSVRGMWQELDRNGFDMILLDYQLRDGSGLEVVRDLTKLPASPPVLLITGEGDEYVAAEAIKQGACEYVRKGDDLSRLPQLIRSSIQRHTSDRLQEEATAQRLYQAWLLENMGDAVVATDEDGRIRFWNRAASQFFGYRFRDVYGMRASEILADACPDCEPSLFQRLLTGDGVEEDINVRRAEEGPAWLRARSFLLDAEMGFPSGHLILFKDITDQYLAQKKLDLLEASFEYAQDGVLVTEGGVDWFSSHIIYVNRSFCEMSGVELTDAMGKTPSQLFQDSLSPNEIGDFRRQLGRGGSYSGELTQQTGNGSMNVFDIRITPVRSSSGEITSWVSIQRDVTEQKALENQVRIAQEKLMQAARYSAIGDLATNLAHRINNPLTTILGESQLLARQLEKGSEAHQAALAIEEAGWRAVEVVQQLMEFSSPTTSPSDEFDVNGMLLTVLDLIGHTIERRGIAIKIHLGANLSRVQGKEAILMDAIINLILAASQVSLASDAPEILLKSLQNGNCTQIMIAYPIPRSPAYPTTALGYGFHLGEELVRQFGGEVEVREQTGKNTAIIGLPVAQDGLPDEAGSSG